MAYLCIGDGSRRAGTGSIARGPVARAGNTSFGSGVFSAGRDLLWDSVGRAGPYTFPASSQWLPSHRAVRVGEAQTLGDFRIKMTMQNIKKNESQSSKYFHSSQDERVWDPK